MGKKLISCLIAFVIMCSASLTISACVASVEESELKIDQEIADDILSRYEREIEYIEVNSNQKITELSTQTIDLIKLYAAHNLDNSAFDFSRMMGEIAVACVEAQSGQDELLYISRSTPTMNILYGEHCRDVAVGAAENQSYSSTFEIGVDMPIAGVNLSQSFSQEYSYTISGPETGETLYNGVGVTHRTAFAVLYGVVVNGVIDPNTAIIINYTLLANIGIPTYCDTASNSGTYYFSTPLQYRNAFSSPSPFL